MICSCQYPILLKGRRNVCPKARFFPNMISSKAVHVWPAPTDLYVGRTRRQKKCFPKLLHLLNGAAVGFANSESARCFPAFRLRIQVRLLDAGTIDFQHSVYQELHSESLKTSKLGADMVQHGTNSVPTQYERLWINYLRWRFSLVVTTLPGCGTGALGL